MEAGVRTQKQQEMEEVSESLLLHEPLKVSVGFITVDCKCPCPAPE